MKTLQLLLISFLFPILGMGQISVKKSISENQQPDITWEYPMGIDSIDFTIFRASVRDKVFHKIQTFHYLDASNPDTARFVMVDTTLVKEGIYLYKIRIQLEGNTIESQIAMGHNYKMLPHPDLSFFNAKSLEDRKGVKLNWKFNYANTLRTIELYRSKDYDSGYIKVADLPAQSTEYVDYVDIANEAWFYFIKALDYFGELPPSVRIPVIPTFGEKPIAPLNFTGKIDRDGIELHWRNDNPVKSYNVFRKTDQDTEFQQITDLVQNDSTKIIFRDQATILRDILKVRYCVTNVNDAFLESTFSDTVSFHFLKHEKVLPPASLDYFKQGENIRLIWQKPKEGMTLGYNVYLTDSEENTILLNPKGTASNYYIDSILRPAGKYVYAVEGIGVEGKKSQLMTRIVVQRDKIKFHIIMNLQKAKNGIEISWADLPSKPVKKYQLYKKSGKGKMVLKKSFTPGKDIRYIDTKVQKGVNYLYVLKALLLNGKTITVNEGVNMIY